ncbi:hypothetical protein WEI85_36760 [Actinomycetes bacterium KLBMP 9797]
MLEAASIGSILEDRLVLDDGQLADPHELYAVLREQRPVVPDTVPSGIRVWSVTRHQDARTALADPRLANDSASAIRLLERHTDPAQFQVAAAKAFPDHMLNTDPPDHTRLRRLVARAFTARGIARYRPRIAQIAGEQLDVGAAEAARTGGEVDLLNSFAFPFPITVITTRGARCARVARGPGWSPGAAWRCGRARGARPGAAAPPATARSRR